MKKRALSKKVLAGVLAAALAMSLLPVSALAEVTTAADEYVYVTMNIPYADFYAADITNSVAVDAVTSATSNKWKNSMSNAGCASVYTTSTEESTGQILGVKYAVKISSEDLSKLSTTLTENDDYYYTALATTPSAYKEATVNTDGTVSFGAIVGTTTALSDITVTLATSSRYGDYELTVTGYSVADGETLVGVIVSTTDGKSYGLRGLENIWKNGTDLSWSCGYTTTESHGNTLSYAHYASMMGKTISGLTYITDGGVYTVSVDPELYVAKKYAGASVEVADADISAGKTAVTISGLPSDFVPVYTVADGIKATKKAVKWSSALPGTYTLTVSDKNGAYVSTSATFTLSTDTLTVKYDTTTGAIAAAAGATSDDLKNYLANITAVSINGTSYAGQTIIGEDGTIDPAGTVTVGSGREATTEAAFAEDGTYEIEVTSTGYNKNLTFSVTIENGAVVTLEAQSLKVANKKQTLEVSTKAQKFKLSTTGNEGTVTYTKLSGSDNLTITKKGVVKVKKGTAKGTYTIKVAVTAAESGAYGETTKVVTVKVKVKK